MHEELNTDTRLTDYALGELDEAARREMAKHLATDPAAQLEVLFADRVNVVLWIDGEVSLPHPGLVDVADGVGHCVDPPGSHQ